MDCPAGSVCNCVSSGTSLHDVLCCDTGNRQNDGRAVGHRVDVVRFLAVLVVATLCPLLISIPVAIIDSISLAARRGIIIRDNAIPVTFRFRDQQRPDGASFVRHLSPKHHFSKVMIVSGDRESEVRYLADLIGIQEVHFSQTPEQKLELIRRETLQANTVFVGEGINDAPALTCATVGIALGGSSDITSEAAHAVILDSSLSKVDELLHIGQQLRRIVLQSAVGGMAFSGGAMLLAAFGLLPPVTGAIVQEVIDLLAVLNALRASQAPKHLTDFDDAD
jgi:cation transport ATPase